MCCLQSGTNQAEELAVCTQGATHSSHCLHLHMHRTLIGQLICAPHLSEKLM